MARRLAALSAAAAALVTAVAAGTPGSPALGADELAAARPELVLVFEGRGFGHGVGMSQYGARGAALEGLSAEEILAHYYRGAELGRAPARTIRALVASGVGSARAGSDRPWRLSRPGEVERILPGGASVVLDAAGARAESVAPGGVMRLDGARYRGALVTVAGAEGVDVVNHVDVEDYLRGVVAREMPPQWGDDAPAALAAQAIAARTYALATLRPDRTFDVFADERSQAYGGVDVEDARPSAAVAATAGRVLLHDGEVFPAYYSSSSGGRTEDADRVFPAAEPQPQMVSVADPYDRISPLHRWPQPPAYTPAELAGRLGLGRPVVALEALELGASPRVLRARARAAWPIPVTSELTGPEVRAALELPDTWFTVVRRLRGRDGIPLPVAAGAPRADVWLAVLNGGGPSGAAARAAGRAAELGYRGVSAGNARRTVPRSVVLAMPGAGPAAQVVAGDLGVAELRTVAPDDPLAAGAPRGAQVVLVVGPDAPAGARG